eukprot:Sspe_Gene.77139::Locus_48176_Transcript_1_1_Confidence_1.000_Length_1970::g.77139::m.77139
MGCGSSSSGGVQESEERRDASKKYQASDEKKVKRLSPKGSPTDSPRSASEEPKKKKFDKHAAEPLQIASVLGEGSKFGKNTKAYLYRRVQSRIRSDPAEEGDEVPLYELARGSMALARPPPPPSTSTPGTPRASVQVTVNSDFSKPFSFLLHGEDAEEVKLGEDGEPDVSALELENILTPYLRSTELIDATLRGIPGFNRSIGCVAVSYDDRLLAVCMGGGRVIPVGTGVNRIDFGALVNGSPRTHSASSTSSLKIGESPRDALMAQFKADAYSRYIRMIDLFTLRPIGLMKQKGVEPEIISDMHFAPDCQHLFSGSTEGTLGMWQVGRLKLSNKSFEVGNEFNPPGRVNQLRLSPDGTLVACATEDIAEDGELCGSVSVWRVSTAKQLVAFTEHASPVTAVAIHPNSQIIASGDKMGELKVWKALTAEVLQTISGHSQPLRNLQWHWDGSMFLSCDERFVRVWKYPEWRPIWTKHIDSAAVVHSAVDDPEDDADELYNMVPPTNQSRMRVRLSMLIPGKAVLYAITTRLLSLLSLDTGEEIMTFTTKAPIACASAGRTVVAMGDVWGNLYLLDLKMRNALPGIS